MGKGNLSACECLCGEDGCAKAEEGKRGSIFEQIKKEPKFLIVPAKQVFSVVLQAGE